MGSPPNRTRTEPLAYQRSRIPIPAEQLMHSLRRGEAEASRSSTRRPALVHFGGLTLDLRNARNQGGSDSGSTASGGRLFGLCMAWGLGGRGGASCQLFQQAFSGAG